MGFAWYDVTGLLFFARTEKKEPGVFGVQTEEFVGRCGLYSLSYSEPIGGYAKRVCPALQFSCWSIFFLLEVSWKILIGNYHIRVIIRSQRTIFF